MPRSAVDRFVNVAEYRRSNWFCREFETRPLIRDREISMPKNIVLCCDGTANEFAQDRTNVVKLYFTLDPDPARQVTYYHPGLGTMEPPGALSGATARFHATCGQSLRLRARGRHSRRVRLSDEQLQRRRSRVPVRVQPRRLYRARGGIAAAHVRTHSARQRCARALRRPPADGDPRNRQQGPESHAPKKSAISILPPTSRARLRHGFASRGLSACGTR